MGACPKAGPLRLTAPFQKLLSGRTTSPFGVRRQYGTLFTSYHEGLDFAAPEGIPVRAVAGGRVVLSERLKARGEAVVGGFAPGTGTWPREGSEEVAAGQVLGLLGSTGLSTGPHLHLEVRLFGVPVDPVPFFAGLPFP